MIGIFSIRFAIVGDRLLPSLTLEKEIEEEVNFTQFLFLRAVLESTRYLPSVSYPILSHRITAGQARYEQRI